MKALALVAMMLLGLPALAADGLNLAYRPMRVDWNLEPGESVTETVQIKNQSAEGVHLRARVMDFFVSEDNTPQFVAEGDDGYSCRHWVVLNPLEVDIDADSVATFRYTLQAPAGLDTAGRTYRCALAFESMPTLADRIAKRPVNQVRLVTVIYATIGTPEPSPSIGTPELTTSEWVTRVPFANLGETHYRLKGQLIIESESGGAVEEIEMDSSPIHPGTAVRIPFFMEPLGPGAYTMTIHLLLGDRILEKKAIFEIPSEVALAEVADPFRD